MDYLTTAITIASVPILCTFLSMTNKMVDSMNSYHVKETGDIYMLIERIEDLENEVKQLKELKQNDLQTSYNNLLDKLNE